ncbi:MAG: hypothetical protein N3E41_05740 [Thermofilaceae archaeon]|nr:hypothetical protein [Thermofilaceae archaeon]
MNAILEYLAIGVLIVAVLLATGQMIEAPSRTLETVRAEQLFTIAERLMDKILLTTGHPPNWGSDPFILDANVTDFGLALEGAKTPYVIDPDKVMRLANLSLLPNPILMNADRIAELLQIKGSYGFRLEMRPMIITRVNTTNWVDEIASTFRVQVTNWYGVGLPNARVKGLYVLALLKGGAGQPEIDKLHNFTQSCVTDALGYCTLDFASHILSQRLDGGKGNRPDQGKGDKGQRPSVFLVLHVDWEGFVSVNGFSPAPAGSPVSGYIYGNYVFIERVEDATGALIVKDEIVQVVPQYALLLDPTDVLWCRSQPNKKDSSDPEWCHEVSGRVLPSRRRQGVNYLVGKVLYLERLSSHVIIFGKWKGDWTAIVISRIPEVDITYGPEDAQPVNSVTLTRIAQIYNYPYVIRLTVWRRLEGWP